MRYGTNGRLPQENCQCLGQNPKRRARMSDREKRFYDALWCGGGRVRKYGSAMSVFEFPDEVVA